MTDRLIVTGFAGSLRKGPIRKSCSTNARASCRTAAISRRSISAPFRIMTRISTMPMRPRPCGRRANAWRQVTC
jgi:hypothetical protein